MTESEGLYFNSSVLSFPPPAPVPHVLRCSRRAAWKGRFRFEILTRKPPGLTRGGLTLITYLVTCMTYAENLYFI